MKLPDLKISYSVDNFTQIPNKMLRDPDISAKAKGLLCILLSNRDGWYSYLASLQKITKDGESAITSGLKELEDHGYLLRIRYRNKTDKKIRGVIWCYTDNKGAFDLSEIFDLLEQNDLEPTKKTISRFSISGFPQSGKARPNNIIYKNTKEIRRRRGVKNSNSFKRNNITPSMFEKFWSIYPKKTDKGKAKTSWEKICRRKPNERPTWNEIESAIIKQKESQRWQDPKYIPMPSTWLNQQRWLDDPEQMVSYSFEKKDNPPISLLSAPSEQIKARFEQSHLTSIFAATIYRPARKIFVNNSKEELARALINLYDDIENTQNKEAPAEVRKLIPGPIAIISNYLNWLERNDWLKSPTVTLLKIDHTLFQKFRRVEASLDVYERDPVNGRSYMRG